MFPGPTSRSETDSLSFNPVLVYNLDRLELELSPARSYSRRPQEIRRVFGCSTSLPAILLETASSATTGSEVASLLSYDSHRKLYACQLALS